MIITTTPTIEGKRIVAYRGIVFGEVVQGINFVKDFGAGLSNFFGGRSSEYEEELMMSREKALEEMMRRAEQSGANAIVGIDFDYEVLGSDNGMLMVTVNGTAVVVE
ncbi:MAG: putative heavy metal-binding protein [Agathobacter sp.]|nr:putative heavy metal-binding protein [Agathobacter sp.]